MKWHEIVGVLCGVALASAARAAEPGQENFSLRIGKGLPVCEAYLTYLNQVTFEFDPYCDRSSDVKTPRITYPDIVPLSHTEILNLYPSVQGLIYHNDTAFYDKHPGPRQGLRSIDLEAENYAKQQEYPARGPQVTRSVNWPKFFRYQPTPDIDNDGTPDDVIGWRQTGLACGIQTGADPDPKRSAHYLLLLRGGQLDVARTKAVFGHPQGDLLALYDPRIGGERRFPAPGRLRLLGTSFGLFKFDKQFYFDTFYAGPAGDLKNERADDPQLRDTLAVYKREAGTTALQCEMIWNRPAR
jgi:hypothetical protein